MVVHVASKDGVIIVRSAQVWRLFVCILAKLLLEFLFVAHNNIFVFAFQQTDEVVNDLKSSAPERKEDQDLMERSQSLPAEQKKTSDCRYCHFCLEAKNIILKDKSEVFDQSHMISLSESCLKFKVIRKNQNPHVCMTI